MKRIFLDIETLPPEICGHENCNNRDPCTDEEYRKLALRAESGRLLCIGVIVEEGNNIIHQGVLGRDRATLRFHLDEERTLRSFWKLFNGFNAHRDLVIGYNIYDFDLAYIYKKSVVHQVKPAVQLSFARYRSQPIYDAMREWERWSFNRISLADLAKTLNLKSSKGELDGSRVYDYFMRDRHVEIADYCLRDVILTREIYYRLQFEECVAKAS
jgi:DNA polymerase elongation subunit (family B)